MVNKLTFDSTAFSEGTVLNLACGYVSQNEITFIKENIIVTIEARLGKIQFCDPEHNVLLSEDVQVSSAGDEKFSEVKCIAEDGQIKLGFPEYTYKDNYPNCDGESDRWSKTILDFNFLCYDIRKNCLIE